MSTISVRNSLDRMSQRSGVKGDVKYIRGLVPKREENKRCADGKRTQTSDLAKAVCGMKSA